MMSLSLLAGKTVVVHTLSYILLDAHDKQNNNIHGFKFKLLHCPKLYILHAKTIQEFLRQQDYIILLGPLF